MKKVIGDSIIEGDFTKIDNLVKKLARPIWVDVGILGQASYEEGATVAGIGAVHEFGSIKKNIPARSFIKMPLEKKRAAIEKAVSKDFEKNLTEGEIEKIFSIIGLAAESVIQDAFETGGFGQWPDITDKTKNKKGSSAILIDQGVLRRAVTSKVGKGS